MIRMDNTPDRNSPERAESKSLREIFTEEEIADALTLLTGNRSFAVNAAAELYSLDSNLEWGMFGDTVLALASVSTSAAERVQTLTGETDEQIRRRIDDFAKRMRERRRP